MKYGVLFSLLLSGTIFCAEQDQLELKSKQIMQECLSNSQDFQKAYAAFLQIDKENYSIFENDIGARAMIQVMNHLDREPEFNDAMNWVEIDLMARHYHCYDKKELRNACLEQAFKKANALEQMKLTIEWKDKVNKSEYPKLMLPPFLLLESGIIITK